MLQSIRRIQIMFYHINCIKFTTWVQLYLYGIDDVLVFLKSDLYWFTAAQTIVDGHPIFVALR